MLESKRKLAVLMLAGMEKQARFLDAGVETWEGSFFWNIWVPKRKMEGKARYLVSNRMQSDKHDFLYDPRPGK